MKDTSIKPKLVDTEYLKKYLSCGRAKAVEIGKQANALVKLGRLDRWDIGKIEEYINAMRE